MVDKIASHVKRIKSPPADISINCNALFLKEVIGQAIGVIPIQYVQSIVVLVDKAST